MFPVVRSAFYVQTVNISIIAGGRLVVYPKTASEGDIRRLDQSDFIAWSLGAFVP